MKQPFKQLCNEYPLSEKLWITDNYIAANAFLQQIALDGFAWAHVRVISSFALAQKIVKSYYPELRFVSEGNKRLILEDLFDKASHKGELPYFQNLHHPLGLLDSLSSFISWMKQISFPVENLDSKMFISREKGENLKVLCMQYEQFLRQNNLYDKEMCFLLASEYLKTQKDWDVPSVLFWGEQEEVSQEEQTFLYRFAKGNVRVFSKELLPEGVGAKELLGEGLRSNGATFLISYSPWCEVRNVLQECLSRKIRWDQLEILYPDRNTYLPLLQDICSHLNIPVTFEEGISLIQTRAGQFLNAMSSCLSENYQDRYFLEMLANGCIKPPEGIMTDEVLRIIRSKHICWGAARWAHILKETQQNPSKEESWTLLLCKDFFETIAPKKGCVSLLQFADGLALFIEKYCVQDQSGDKEFLIAHLKSLVEWDIECVSVSKAMSQIIRILQKQRFHLSGPRSGSLHIRPLRQKSYIRRPSGICLGLNDLWIPGPIKSDALILEEEKQEIAPNQNLSSDLGEEMIMHVKDLLISFSKNLIVSCVKMVPFKASYGLLPSPVMLWAYRKVTGKDSCSYEYMVSQLDQELAYKPSEGSFPVFKWEGSHLDSDQSLFLQQGCKALKERQTDQVTKYDGKLSLDPSLLDLKNNPSHSISATSLQALATCPFQYYLRYVLKLKGESEDRMDSTRWLNATSLGSLVHSIYFDLMQKWRNQEDWTSEDASSFCETLLEKSIGLWKEKVPVPSEKIFQKEVLVLKGSFKDFVLHENRRKDRKVSFLEVAFGRTQTIQKGDLKKELPVKFMLKDGDFLMLSGSIDRVDQNKDGSYVIVDYKTSASGFLKPTDLYRKGTMLQPFLYAGALCDILKKEQKEASVDVKQTGYFYATQKGQFQEHLYSGHFDPSSLQDVIGEILNTIRDGVFVVMKDLNGTKGPCHFCLGKDSCQMYRGSAMKTKFEQEENRCLEPLLALQKVK